MGNPISACMSFNFLKQSSSAKGTNVLFLRICHLCLTSLKELNFMSGDFTNQNATQFENTETEKGPGRERRHERGKNKVTDANATTETVQLCKSFKLR